MTYILLGKGFEEIEAVTPYDLLVRAGTDVKFAGVGGKLITGAHGITMRADVECREIRPEEHDRFVIPGGLGGIESIMSDAVAMNMLQAAKGKGASFAAICAGPKVLDELGVLEGKRFTCFPGFEENIYSGSHVGGQTCIDGNLITANGPIAAFEFGYLLAEDALGRKAAEAVGAEICI